MKIEKINNNNTNTVNNEIINFEKGDIISGEIKSLKDNKYIIHLEDKYYINVDKDKISNKVGDTVYFRVEDEKNTLKQIFNTESQDNLNNDINNIKIKRNLDKNTLLNNRAQQQYKLFLDKNSQPSVQENNLYNSKIKNKLSHLSNTVNKKSLQNLINNGVDPKKVDVLTFSDYLSISTGVDVENKEKPEEKTLQELKEDKKKAIKMDLNMNGLDEEDLFNFEDILSKVGLPNTDKNISALKNVKDKIDNIENIDKDTSLNIIKKGNKTTIEDLYSSKYSRVSNKDSIDIENIENLEEQIKNILNQNDIEIHEENIAIAKDFIKSEVDISSENIKKYKKLANIKQEIDIKNILEKSANNILKNENVLDIDIFNNETIEQYIKYKNMLPKILPEHIQGLIDENININLKNIENNYKNINIQNINVTEEAISERLNLSKIQLKLTTEAMYSLYDKGINIDTKPLKDVINYLENIEQENYKKYLQINKVEPTQNNVETMKNVFSTIKSFYPNAVYNTFKDIIDKKIDFSLSGINKSLKSQNIIDTFETFKTTPNKSFGDSINKLTEDFKDLLIKNGFEPTQHNIKALKILSLNNIDFTEENILNIKLLDNKIDYVANNLHPLTVAKMLKYNFNPMDRKIDEVIDYIDNNKFGQTSREKIAEQILDIDRENILSKEERNAIIAVYRMLNIVQKGDSASIGNLLKAEKNVTLSNLLEASKIYEKSRKNIGFDKKIDKSVGESEKIIPEDNITNAIKSGIEKANENYNKFILNQILNYANPDKILQIDNFNTNIENILDKLKDKDKQTISNNTQSDLIKSIQSLESVDIDTINYLTKNNLPITLDNIQIMENIIKKNTKLSKDIDDFKSELEKRDISFGESIFNIEDDKNMTKEELLNTMENLNQENQQVFDEIINLEDLDDIKYMILKNKKVSSNINFMQDYNNIKNGKYTLPMKLSTGKITDLNMYILNDMALNDKNLNLYLNFENDNNKSIEAYVKVFNDGTIVDIVTDTTSDIQNYEKDVLNILSNFNIYPDNITYSVDNPKDLYKEDNILNIEEKFKDFDNNFNKVI
ncbi:DUF6240 domain-containing protein [[Clostridium] colinum]|uniref:DUF6240 domain-containing protein n=1 Tax=[Clostridium] colinum TaxID=36835 RepID=UPI0020244B21|nr:DUF6240 domain-containing protein [[Clostridium] colinum]